MVSPIDGIYMKKIIVVFLTLSLIGCGSSAKKENLSQEDVKYNLEQAKYFKNLAIEAGNKKDIELACQYIKSELDYATKAGDNKEVAEAIRNSTICYYELSTRAYSDKNYALSCSYMKPALDIAIKLDNEIKLDNTISADFKEQIKKRISFYTENKNIICNTTETLQTDSAQAKQQSNIAGAMLGRWYHQEEGQVEGGYVEMKAVDNYLANGEESSQQQVIIGIDSYELACIVNQSIEWSASGNTLYEKTLNVTVAPDWIKFNGQVVNDNKKLMEYCNAIKEKISTHLFTTESIVIKYIDNEKKVQESVRSNGEIERNTHYRTTNSFSYYRKD